MSLETMAQTASSCIQMQIIFPRVALEPITFAGWSHSFMRRMLFAFPYPGLIQLWLSVNPGAVMLQALMMILIGITPRAPKDKRSMLSDHLHDASCMQEMHDEDALSSSPQHWSRHCWRRVPAA